MVWTRDNLRHLADHPERGITQADVDEAMNDPKRIETRDPAHNSTVVVGRTAAGRLLVVAWVNHRDGRLPVHFRPAGRRVKRQHQ